MCLNIFKKNKRPEQHASEPKPQPSSQEPSQPQTAPVPGQTAQQRAPNPELHATTKQAIDVYLASKQEDGMVAGIGWWQVANGYTAIALHDYYSHNGGSHSSVLREQLARSEKQHKHFVNEFNDDSLWWGHASLDQYALDHDSKHMHHADKVFEHVRRYQLPFGKHFIEENVDMGGACLWTSKDGEDGANTITTSLYAELAARLALLSAATKTDPNKSGARKYLEAAIAACEWILGNVYRESDDIILDGISMNEGGKRSDWTFTYTTGQSIAAFITLATALRQAPSLQSAPDPQRYVNVACRLARASVRRDIWTNADGVLIEHKKGEQDPWEGGDGWVFESVLVRGMAKLYRGLRLGGFVEGDTAARVRDFVEAQFASLTRNDRSEDGRGGQYGPWWEGPFEAPTSHSQLAVLDVMAAIHAVRD